MTTKAETTATEPTELPLEQKEEAQVAPAPEDDDSDFNFIQRWAFPVRLRELPKVIPVVLLMAIALVIYTANRDVKDAVIFGEEGQSMMTVQYCKVVVMIVALPTASAFLKLDNMVSRDFIFFQTVLLFGAYFLLNGLLLLPYRDAIHQYGSQVIRDVHFGNDEKNVARLSPLLGTMVFPVSTLNYILSELWGTVSVSFLVWGYVNMVTPKQAARRYYAVLGIGAQFGSMAGAGFVTVLAEAGGTFETNMRLMNSVMAVMCTLFAAVYAFLQYYIMKMPQYAIPQKPGKKKKGKAKMSVGQALKYCLSNSYVLALCGMVFAYGFVMVVGELTYKELMKLSFNDDQNKYSSFKGVESSLCGGVAIFLMIFVAHNVIRLFGWTVTAMLCPVICALLGVTMYIMALSGNYYTEESGKYRAKDDDKSLAYLEMLRYVGLAFAVASKAAKYASFDPAKELAFLVLGSEQKYKAKAAVDIIGARCGKGTGALFNIIVISLILGLKVSYVKSGLVASFVGILAGLVLWVFSDVFIGANMDKVAKQTEDEAATKEPAFDSIQVEGAKSITTAHKHDFHIEMSTNPDASFTAGQGSVPTPMPSRQNSPLAKAQLEGV